MPFDFEGLGLGVLAEALVERLCLLCGESVSLDATDCSNSGNLKDSVRFGDMDHGRSELVGIMIHILHNHA